MPSLSDKPSKSRFIGPDILQNHTKEEKVNDKKKDRGGRKRGEEKKKANGFTLSFYIMATMRIVFGQKIPLDRKGSFGGNVFKTRPKNTKTKTLTVQLSL